ncbi:basic salivary proline-rich protein 2-like [Uloborus diversus]|uniref:basic salivary proline-rich protein 2-like n=1 Tax=Uloborus diversus TaxID=327109 RepID=UPI00240973F9|nr:basic salivary proline-rich protein 2-like [Uloborus diversus]
MDGLLLATVAIASCQYPRERAPQPPPRQGPPPEEYAPPPQASRSQSYASDRSPQNLIYRPADVHYVNIGLELAGDYKFGYDTGKANDGQSFREETRLPDGTVQGAYGYVDETGRQRIVRYTAGKDGFKAEGDLGPAGAPKVAPVKPARAAVQTPPQRAYAPPQQSYAPPQQSYAPPQPSYSSPPQEEYQPPPQPQQTYRPPPRPQAAYRPPPAQYSPPPASYSSRPRPQSYDQQPQRPRPQRPVRPAPPPSYDESPDYDNPNNEIGERRLAPIDTSLLNYNIGIALSTLFAFASAQYPYQGQQAYQQAQHAPAYQQQPQAYQSQQQSYQPQPQQYQPQPQAYQPQPQAYQPQPQQPRSHTPAAVHYVNIGAELAGDYKFGYDTGKGTDGQSFREETRLPDGSVQGAYGYVDADGKQRVVRYTAGKEGFKVEGDDIPKAPPAPAAAAPQQQQPNYNNYGGSPNNNYRGY